MDIDNNGWADVFVPRYKTPGYSRLFLNNAGRFTDITDQTPFARIEDQNQEMRTFTVVWADYDNDGVLDLFASGFASSSKLLFHNNGDGSFTKVGENLFLETQASGPPIIGDPALDGFGALQQGALEASNVNAVEELVGLIETQRAYEMNTRAVDTTDQMLQFLTNNL